MLDCGWVKLCTDTIRGQTALKIVQDANDLNAAAVEFKQALGVAPWLAGAYFNLALVQEKQKNYADAIRNFKLYAMAAPQANDLAAIRQKIIELEYLEERKQASPPVVSIQPSIGSSIQGNGAALTSSRPSLRFRVSYLVGWNHPKGWLIVGDGMIEFSDDKEGRSFKMPIEDVTEILKHHLRDESFYLFDITQRGGKTYKFSFEDCYKKTCREHSDALYDAILEMGRQHGKVWQ